MWRARITDADPLLGVVDPEERFARFPPDYTIKGMFFARLVERLGEARDPLMPHLLRPPRALRYLPFSDYPQLDYSRIAHAVAVRAYPGPPVPEAMRRLARSDFASFARSRVGRVMLAMAGDLETALRRVPDMYNVSIRGGSVRNVPADDGARIEFRDFYGWLDCYPVGTLEGIVLHFGFRPVIDVEFHTYSDAVFHIRWDR